MIPKQRKQWVFVLFAVIRIIALGQFVIFNVDKKASLLGILDPTWHPLRAKQCLL